MTRMMDAPKRLLLSLTGMRWVCAWVAGLLLLTSSAVRAQTASEPDMDAAAAHFESGVVAFREGRPIDAREAFEASLDAAPTVVAAWNLARAWLATGDPIRALELVELTAMGQYGEPSEAQSDSLRRLREDLELRIAILELRTEVTLDLELDDRSLGAVDPEGAWRGRVLPGNHVVRATDEDGNVRAQSVTLRAGEVTELLLEAPPPDRRALRIGLGVGAGAVLAGVVALVVWALARPEPDLVVDPVWGNTRLP